MRQRLNEVEDFIASGMLELYCLGMANEAEKAEVQLMCSLHKSIREELQRVEERLISKAEYEAITPPENMRHKVMLGIEAAELGLPPLLSKVSSVNEWLNYLQENKIGPVPGAVDLLWVDLPSTPGVVSYAVWAPKGVAVEEEHADEIEHLLMLKGSCHVTIDGITNTYHQGDLVIIPAQKLHRAEAASDGLMVLIGQRVKTEGLTF